MAASGLTTPSEYPVVLAAGGGEIHPSPERGSPG